MLNKKMKGQEMVDFPFEEILDTLHANLFYGWGRGGEGDFS